MRIAWMGPMPSEEGGEPGVNRQLIAGLANLGVQVDCFIAGKPESVPKMLRSHPNVRFYLESSRWSWNRWYSRNRLSAFVTGQAANFFCESRAARVLIEHHRKSPYDVLFLSSHIEMGGVRRFLNSFPTVILRPSVHAAGELRWHRAETNLARQSEPWPMRFAARMLLQTRVFVQKRHVQRPDLIVTMSESFGDELVRDYGVPKSKLRVVPNPIDIVTFRPNSGNVVQGPWVFLFVSRIAVRKGVEMIVELSHRLNDMNNRVKILVVGEHSLWSDYRGLLKHLNSRTAEYIGGVDWKGMPDLYRSAHALIQPSHYEPFGLTVGEALASGLPVVVSTKVGAGEHVDPRCCRVFTVGDMDHLEREVRRLASDLEDAGRRTMLSSIARAEAIRLYSPDKVARDLYDVLSAALHNSSTESNTMTRTVCWRQG